jgi:large subunit ribosomal protein L6e
VNQRYVIATSTKVEVSSMNLTAVDDALFVREKKTLKQKKSEALAAVEAGSEANTRVMTAERKEWQDKVDTQLKAIVDKKEMLGAYLSARFSLSKSDKPHLMKF